ncbi:MAG: hypothetical protein WDM71_03705 [Ferruginibacter sp.]
MVSFTSEDIIQYIYNETTPERNAVIQTALETDWNLREKYEVIRYAHRRLGIFKCSPSKRSVDHILSYAEKLTRETEEA